VGRLKDLVYSVELKMKRSFTNALLGVSDHSQPPTESMKVRESPQSYVSMCALIGLEDVVSIPCKL